MKRYAAVFSKYYSGGWVVYDKKIGRTIFQPSSEQWAKDFARDANADDHRRRNPQIGDRVRVSFTNGSRLEFTSRVNDRGFYVAQWAVKAGHATVEVLETTSRDWGS